MSKDAYKSFEVRTARDYFEQLVSQSFEDFKRDNLSSKAAIVCAMFTWHLHEWIWAQNHTKVKIIPGIDKIGDFQKYLFNECSEFRILVEVANGSKHFNSDRKGIKSTQLQHGFYSPIGIMQSHLTVTTDNKLYFFIIFLISVFNIGTTLSRQEFDVPSDNAMTFSKRKYLCPKAGLTTSCSGAQSTQFLRFPVMLRLRLLN